MIVGGGGGGSDMMEMVDTIFVSGLPENIDEDGLVQHFGSIGVIKVIFKDSPMGFTIFIPILLQFWIVHVYIFHDRRIREPVNQKYGSTKTKTLEDPKERQQLRMMIVKRQKQQSIGSMVSKSFD